MKTETKEIIHNSSVAESFSSAAETYHEKATIQKKVAGGLISSLKPWKETIPAGDILEVGCGTGFLTELLISEFPDRNLLITDVAEGMLDFCMNQLSEKKLVSDNVSFELLDVNELEVQEQKYSLIISNFAAQWFTDTAIGLEKLSTMLKPGGLMLCAFPGNHSFEEWYNCCLELGLPFTANPLPDVEEVVIKLSINPLQIDYYENDLHQEFDSSLQFFKHLKAIGASESTSGKQLNGKQLRLLTNFWDEKASEKVKVKWHVVYLAAKKDL